MKELLVISGKGGTGKTSVTASFAALAKNAVFADCDVDAADLYLLFDIETIKKEEFYSGTEPAIIQDKCDQCSICYDLCKFDAIGKTLDSKGKVKFEVKPFSCEGCGVCIDNCPISAIKEMDRLCGHIYLSKTQYGTLSHAKLLPGGENSGKLVSAVRKQAHVFASEHGAEWLLIDGSPGIGCPVIASVTGVDRVLLVTEPTVSGIHDLERVFQLCKHFKVPIYVCVNKFDLNIKNTDWIKNYTIENNETWIGTIPYDNSVTDAQNLGIPVVNLPKSLAGESIKEMWAKIKTDTGEIK
ncbi:MAG: ATP-binding protein [Caldisericia bacterium]|nr:ATP-binding protein [Caldisericia bacterium]